MLARLLARTAVVVLAAGTVTGVAQVPVAALQTSQIWASSWAYTRSDEPKSSFVNATANVPVGRVEEGPSSFKGRSYFTFDVTRLNGMVVSVATLVLKETAVNACGVTASVEVWRTASLGSAPTWAHSPAEIEKLGVAGPGANYHCPGYRVLDIGAALAAAVARGDATVTLGVRIAQNNEGSDKYGRWLKWRPYIDYTANTPPVASRLRLEWYEQCGTLASPTILPGGARVAVVDASDADLQDRIQAGEFATWPVDYPDQRTQYAGSSYTSMVKATIGGNYPHGTVVAYVARVSDGHDFSDWTAPCYYVVDATPPANAPHVSSSVYPEGQEGGGPGIPGTFILDAQRDSDVVQYHIRDQREFEWTIDAPSPGAQAQFVYTPPWAGPAFLKVRAVDRAGNISPTTQYEFRVRHTAPDIQVEMNGIGLPSTFTFRSAIVGITHYTYRIDDGPETTVPLSEPGVAVVQHTFTTISWPRLTAASHTADGPLGIATLVVQASNFPKVESANFDGSYHHGLVGEPMTFTFRPRSLNVAGYQYQLNWDQPYATVNADTNGVATLTWTPTEQAFWQAMIRTVHADGSYSEWTPSENIMILDPRPWVEGDPYNPWEPAGGVGIPGTFSAYSAIGEPAEFIISFNSGPEFTVPAEGSNTVWFELTPDRSGENTITVKARLDDATITPTRVWTFLVA